MKITEIDGNTLKKMMISGANALTRSSAALDALNVFPVPDGDTGINMSQTVQVAAREAEKAEGFPTVHAVAKVAASGALRGARGNSGVILSQLYRGFAKGLEGKTTANTEDLSDAFAEASKMAYKAVMKPKEGTILTIAKAVGEHAQERAYTHEETDIEKLLLSVIECAGEVLNQTTFMLPELRQAGVVDAGGKGLLCLLQGMLEGLKAVSVPPVITKAGETKTESVSTANAATAAALSEADIKFAYCTEFLIEAGSAENQAEALQSFLLAQGDSVVVVADEAVIKVHIHTNHPGLVIEHALKIGQLTAIKIDNMRYQHTALMETTELPTNAQPLDETRIKTEFSPIEEEKEIGFVAVASGEGLCALFMDLGADAVVKGGQTMNPSAEDIASAVMSVNARNVIVLPNNKNIILAAEQAVHLVPEDKTIHVVPTKSIPQGVACILDFLDTLSAEENADGMKEHIQHIPTGQVTYAVRDTVWNGREIKSGDILGLYNGEIVLTGTDIREAAQQLMDYMLKDGGEFISVYYGEGITEESAEELCAYISEKKPGAEAQIYNGGQPLYYYIISVE